MTTETTTTPVKIPSDIELLLKAFSVKKFYSLSYVVSLSLYGYFTIYRLPNRLLAGEGVIESILFLPLTVLMITISRRFIKAIDCEWREFARSAQRQLVTPVHFEDCMFLPHQVIVHTTTGNRYEIIEMPINHYIEDSDEAAYAVKCAQTGVILYRPKSKLEDGRFVLDMAVSAGIDAPQEYLQ